MNEWFENLKPEAKLLWLYFLTCPSSNLLGIFEISLKRCSNDIGLSIEIIEKILKLFEKEKSAFYFSGRVFLPNWLKEQSFNPNMRKRAFEIFNELPDDYKNKINQLGYELTLKQTGNNISNINWLENKQLHDDFKGLPKGSEGLPKGSRIEIEREREIEKEIEKEIERETKNDLFSPVVVKKEQVAVETSYPFEGFWDLYEKKVNRYLSEKKYLKTTEEERKLIFANIPLYKKYQPDPKFRKNPDTYLNNRSWNDEYPKPINTNEENQVLA
ncbi:MAG: hypothetical protein WC389_14530 [Lutibacter sp.]